MLERLKSQITPKRAPCRAVHNRLISRENDFLWQARNPSLTFESVPFRVLFLENIW